MLFVAPKKENTKKPIGMNMTATVKITLNTRPKGIDFDAQEMEVLIEAAVAEFNEAFKQPLLDEGTAKAAYRVTGTVHE